MLAAAMQSIFLSVFGVSHFSYIHFSSGECFSPRSPMSVHEAKNKNKIECGRLILPLFHLLYDVAIFFEMMHNSCHLIF